MTFEIKVRDQLHREKSITAKQGTTLFSAFMEANILLPGNCGGNGTCQACTVFDCEKERYIKCCKTVIETDMCIQLPFAFQNQKAPAVHQSDLDFVDRQLGFAVDLGTTSIGLELYDISSKALLVSHCILNPQVCYGADVISRIQYAKSDESLKELKALTWNCLFSAMMDMLNALEPASEPSIARIAIAGNTTMLYLLMGYEVCGLGAYPFNAEHLDTVTVKLNRVVACNATFSDCMLYAYPGISAFVGSDIISGACAYQLGQKKNYDFLIDFGTNGELYLLNDENGFCGATSCGPAFDAYISSGNYGTDILSRIDLLKVRGILSADGLLSERYQKNGYCFPDGVTIRMRDIRALQQAKAAIRTGIDLLLEKAGISFQDCNVYLAGNFGFHLELDGAFRLGLLPEIPKEQIHIVGNSALKGASLLLFEPELLQKTANSLVCRSTYYDFANVPDFQNHFIKALSFES